MAHRGTPLAASTVRLILASRGTLSDRACAREARVSVATVWKYRRMAREQERRPPAG